MTEIKKRRLPVGIQSFQEIREGGYAYVDKTDLIWQIVNEGDKYNYLSRPRRFGKSILVDTLQCYLEGKKELFEGLKIMELEKVWAKHSVIHFDMSGAGSSREELTAFFEDTFEEYEKIYGITSHPKTLSKRFKNIIMTAREQSGQKVAVLIDEYDSPLQHSWKTPHHQECTEVYRTVFAILKEADRYEKFVFITGITKFTQISLFSVLNNLTNQSFNPQWATICGITEEEIKENFTPELEQMANHNGWSLQEVHDKLKNYYDGYHFSKNNMTDIYNPFSLIKALSSGNIQNFWASSGATTLLPKFVDNMELRLKDFENCPIMPLTLETSDVTGGGSELFLYQSGYLTIKGLEGNIYRLGFPNEEVKQALYETVLPALTMRAEGDIQSQQAQLYLALETCRLEEAMKSLKALIADVPYSNKKLASMDMEERYRLIISSILNAIGFRTEVEHMLSTGRIDILCNTPRYTYVIELKLSKNGGIAAAEKQMKDHQYLEPFKADKNREVIGLAIELEDLGKGLLEWKRVEA